MTIDNDPRLELKYGFSMLRYVFACVMGTFANNRKTSTIMVEFVVENITGKIGAKGVFL